MASWSFSIGEHNLSVSRTPEILVQSYVQQLVVPLAIRFSLVLFKRGVENVVTHPRQRERGAKFGKTLLHYDGLICCRCEPLETTSTYSTRNLFVVLLLQEPLRLCVVHTNEKLLLLLLLFAFFFFSNYHPHHRKQASENE